MNKPADKVCNDCGGIFPLSKDHFRVRKNGEFDTRCMTCRARVNRGKKVKQKQVDMKAIEAGAVQTFVGQATTGGENIPHSSELLERLMEYFGGSTGFAALMVKQYFDSPPGGSHRTKMLEGIVRLVTKNTEMGGAKKPLTQWSDDELESELDDRLRKLALNLEGRFINVQVSPETPSGFAAAFGQTLGVIPAERTAGDAGGISQPPDRGIETVPADATASGDARLPSE